MSKAFTRESDEEPAPQRAAGRARPALPPGARNHITPDGLARVRAEHTELTQLLESAGSAPNPGVPASNVLLQRLAELEETIRTAQVVPPPPPPWEHVRFGGTVTVREGSSAEYRYRIVGADETDFDRGWISWTSPLGRALLGARLGEIVRVKLPAGLRELHILALAYE